MRERMRINFISNLGLQEVSGDFSAMNAVRQSLYWDWMWRTQESADHIALFSPANIAEMAMREGMLLESYRGVLDSGRIAGLRAHISVLLRPIWLRFLPAELFCEPSSTNASRQSTALLRLV
jgi:hypothetical protein